MKVEELKKLLETAPNDAEVTFLCPDGFEDYLEVAKLVTEDGIVTLQFLSYIHREKLKKQ